KPSQDLFFCSCPTLLLGGAFASLRAVEWGPFFLVGGSTSSDWAWAHRPTQSSWARRPPPINITALIRDPHCIRAAGAYVDRTWRLKPFCVARQSKRLSCVGPKRVCAWGLFFCSSLGGKADITRTRRDVRF